MRSSPTLIFLLNGILFGCASPQPEVPVEPTPPNILLVVADDLGNSDLGAYGSGVSTPNIDSLAA